MAEKLRNEIVTLQLQNRPLDSDELVSHMHNLFLISKLSQVMS